MEFSDWLMLQLKERDISQSELARRSGITRQSVINYLAGRIPNPTELKKLARGLRIPVADVFRAAGLLPPAPETDPITARAMELFASLSEAEQAEVLNILEFKERRKREAEEAAQSPGNLSTAKT
ncbi:MAG TPA: helix-turn-helix transcriptional regulator [Anaerolineaceae bacterium]|nr:helix-turn-helix transcriptional regulator [Anaerolineaceae bacterium]